MLVGEGINKQPVPTALPGFRVGRGLVISAGLLALAVFGTIGLRPYPRFAALPAFVYLFAIWTASWWGGYVPGIVICSATFLMVPSLRAGRLAAPGAPTIPFITLMVTCILISRLAASRIKTERILRLANDELEGKVRERTRELELANTTLQQQLAELGTLYEELVFGLGFLDTGLRYIRVNEKLAAIHGKPAEAHFGRSLREMTPVPLADLVEPLYRRVLETGEPLLDHEVRGDSVENERYWSVACAPVRTAARVVVGIQVIVQDVTERKRAERALSLANEKLRQANGDLEQFAYSASHDLQEPLRMVSIYSQMLKKKFGGQLGPLGDEYIQYTVDGSTRMGQLVSDLLAYTRASTWDFDSMGTADPNESIDRAVANLRMAIEQENATITRGPLPQVEMHGFHLDQVFQNLIGNAVKYRGKEPPRIAIGAERGKNEWLFSVNDNGIGIDSQYKEHIFGVFKRLHTAAEFSGTGIGLAICQRIIERRGGRLWVESEPGKGSTFFFTLPDFWEH
jgi:PAS domain S-box-containing protein